MYHLVAFNRLQYLRTDYRHDISVVADVATHPCWLLVQLSEKAVSDVSHDVTKRTKKIRLDILLRYIARLFQPLETIVKHPQYLIHTLCVLNPWIKFGINEQNSC